MVIIVTNVIVELYGVNGVATHFIYKNIEITNQVVNIQEV